MKKIVKILAVLTLFNIAFSSCEKQNELIPKEIQKSNYQKLNLNEPILTSGVLEFKNQNQFLNYIKEIENGKMDEISDFQSFESIFKEIKRNDEKITEKILKGELSNYYFLEKVNGELSIVETINDPSFRKVLNKDRLVIIDKIIYKIDKDSVYYSKFIENFKIENFNNNPRTMANIKINKVERERIYKPFKSTSNFKNGKLNTQSAKQDYHYNGTDFHCTAYIAHHNYLVYRSHVFKIYHEYRRRAWIGWYWADIETPSISFNGRAEVIQEGFPFNFTLVGSVSNSALLSFFLSEVAGTATHSSEVFGTVTYTRRDANWSSHSFSL